MQEPIARTLATLEMYGQVLPGLARTLGGIRATVDDILARTGVAREEWSEMTGEAREALIRQNRRSRKAKR